MEMMNWPNINAPHYHQTINLFQLFQQFDDYALKKIKY